MVEFHVVRIGEVIYTEILLADLDTLISKSDLVVLLIDLVVSRSVFLVFNESLYEGVRIPVHRAGVNASSGNDERCSRLIDKDRVDLVDDSVVELSLSQLLLVCDHVVTQVVKTEFVVSSVRDVGHVLLVTCRSFYSVDNASDLESEEGVQLAHPLSVTLCQIVVDSYYVNALAFKSIQVCGKSSYESLTFTCLHLGYTSLMQNDTADELYSEVLHSEASPRTFTAYRESFRQYVIESLAVSEPVFELLGLASQFIIGQRLHLFVVSLDAVDYLLYLLHLFGVKIAKDLFH